MKDIKDCCKELLLDEPMSKHTSFLAGGKAKYFAKPDGVEELRALLSYARTHSLDYLVMGKGSNILVSDSGYQGLVIMIGKAFSGIKVKENVVEAGSGASMASVANVILENSLTGFEGLSGIPGSIGGAIAMNAGAYGYETGNILEEAEFLDDELNLRSLPLSKLDMGYRRSIFSDKSYVILKAKFRLRKDEQAAIKERMDDFKQRRLNNQPLQYASAGSTFKRPEGYFAGKLIQDAGLKGVNIGEACVSEKHSGFVINKGGATATDIYKLICYIQAKVYAEFKVRLEPEVKLIGDFD